jgi:hypothetical protein
MGMGAASPHVSPWKVKIIFLFLFLILFLSAFRISDIEN